MIWEVRNGVINSFRVLGSLQVLLIELEVASEDLLTDPEVAVSEEEVTIHFLSNLSSVLNGAAHLLHGFPLIFPVCKSTLSEMFLHVE